MMRAADRPPPSERIIVSAYTLFCESGYRGTTMESIAQRAGVAVQTVYFTFRTKDDLLQAVYEWAVLGDDGKPPPMQAGTSRRCPSLTLRRRCLPSWPGSPASMPESRRCCRSSTRYRRSRRGHPPGRRRAAARSLRRLTGSNRALAARPAATPEH
jgi:AcrR family transcriptional regulator